MLWNEAQAAAYSWFCGHGTRLGTVGGAGAVVAIEHRDDEGEEQHEEDRGGFVDRVVGSPSQDDEPQRGSDVDGRQHHESGPSPTTHNAAGEKQRKHHHYLKGSVYCGTCGSRLIITNTTNRHGTTYPYFICIGRQQKRTNCTQKAVLIDHVETLVEDHYTTIQPAADWLQQIKAFILDEITTQREHADQERDAQQRRIRSLNDERKKLLEAHYADAVPVDLLKTEQKRITNELAAAQTRLDAVSLHYDTIEANLEHAIEFATNWQQAYLDASPSVRRQLNQAIFKKLYVGDNDEVRSEFAEPFEILLGDEVATATAARIDLTDEEYDQRWTAIAADWDTDDPVPGARV